MPRKFIFPFFLSAKGSAASRMRRMAFKQLHVSMLMLLCRQLLAHRLADSPPGATETTGWLEELTIYILWYNEDPVVS